MDWFALAFVTAGAGLIRLYRLTQPSFQVFDERTYVKDACFYVHADGRPPCFDQEVTTVHPPLGKWLIGWGIEATDFSAIGWRIAAAIAGTLTVALLYLLARRLLRSTPGALLASGLLAIDFLHFVQSRVGMPDVFVTSSESPRSCVSSTTETRLWHRPNPGSAFVRAGRARAGGRGASRQECRPASPQPRNGRGCSCLRP